MPSKCCCCLTLWTGVNLLGILNWIGTVAGVTLLILGYPQPIVALGWPSELGALLLIANGVPALMWFASIFSPLASTKYAYRTNFIFWQMLVQLYILAVQITNIVLTALRTNQVQKFSTIYAAVMLVVIGVTIYLACCITSWADRSKNAQFA